MDQKLTDNKTNGSESHKRLLYHIDSPSYGNHIEISPHNGEFRLMCWSVDDNDQYKSLIVYKMNRELLKGLADFILKYLENK